MGAVHTVLVLCYCVVNFSELCLAVFSETWVSQQFTNEKLSLKELKWSSPPTNYLTADWNQHYNSSSSINNSNHKPNSEIQLLDAIYYKTDSQLNMRTIINQWNQTFYNVNNSYKLFHTLFLSWIQSQVSLLLYYRTSQNKS